ncbi:MAG: anaerobic ribonucleoside-triphosphate reductase activating protein [Thermodesulfobacteriota bacterium]
MAQDFHIKGFIPVSMLDWPGKVCSIVFLAGCSFRCPACHNADLVIRHGSLSDESLAGVLSHLDRRRNWIDGVTVTGGEPTIHDTLPHLLRTIRAQGVLIKLDTNGSNPRMIEALLSEGLVDAVAMDVKAPFTEEEYAKVAGVQVDPACILRSVEILKASGLEVIFRTTVIPGIVEEPQLRRIRQSLGDVQRFTIQGFRNVQTLDPELRHIPQFSPERLERMRLLFETPSLDVVNPGLVAHAG